ncbi:hypothetical protein LCGC14_2610810 [marine sediment metagenome]|uniref:Uncharacterized protein n=1 Tax=marine sediment metagenome TaxID=412755 RepID=A0A0F9CGZ2_9ZZZZ
MTTDEYYYREIVKAGLHLRDHRKYILRVIKNDDSYTKTIVWLRFMGLIETWDIVTIP